MERYQEWLRAAVKVAAGDPVSLTVTVVVILAVWWLLTQRNRGGKASVLRPVRAQDRAMQRRGVQFVARKIIDIKQLSNNTRQFRVALESPDASVGKHGHFSVQAVVDGQRVVRPYTPVSPPWQKGAIDFVIKRYKYGTLTPHLFSLNVGDSIEMRGPYGGIKYAPNEVTKYVFIGAGTGLTPMLQTIKIALSHTDDTTELLFIFQNREEHDIVMRRHIEELAVSEPRLQVAFFLSRPPAGFAAQRPHMHFEGYVDEARLRQLMGANIAAKAAVCGPPGFNKSVKGVLQTIGVESIRCM